MSTVEPMIRNGPRYRVIYVDHEGEVVEAVGTFLEEDADTYTFSWHGDVDYQSFIPKRDVRQIWSTNRPPQLPTSQWNETRLL